MQVTPEGRTIVEGFLDRTSFLSALSGSTRDRLTDLTRLAAFIPGEVVLHEGAPTPYLGIVVRGRLALRLSVPGRGPATIQTVDQGDIVGWSAVVAPYRSTSTAVALEASELAVFDAAPLREAIAADAELAAAILPPILSAVARRLAACRLQHLDLFAAGEREPW